MDDKQLEKKVEWLDAERREAAKTISQLEKKIAVLKENLESNQKLMKDFTREMSRLSSAAGKINEFSRELKTYRSEIKKEVRASEKESKLRLKDIENEVQTEQKSFAKTLNDFRKELGQIMVIEKDLKERKSESANLENKIDEINRGIEGVVQGEGRRKELARSLEDIGKKDTKRNAEIRGDIAAVLERMEQAQAKIDAVEASQRKGQNQMEDFVDQEEEKQIAQRRFTEKTAGDQLERGRIWREWEKRFEAVEKQSEEIAARLKDIETIDLAVKRAQRSFAELTEKINRRVNELTEVQRLGEQRYRQEWSTFQADSQKRWSGNKLSAEEHQREATRQREKLMGKVAQIEDTLKDLQDTVQHVSNQTELYFQTMLETMRDSLAESERFYGSMR